MATTPQTPRRGARTDITGNEERDTLNPMQEPLGSMDRPVSSTSNINEVNLPPGETVRGTGTLGRNATPGSTAPSSRNREGRGFTATFAIAAIVLLAAFLIAIYLGSNHSNVATTTGTTQAPVADSNIGSTNDTTGSTTVAPSQQQTAPGTGDAGGTTTGGGTTTAPANP